MKKLLIKRENYRLWFEFYKVALNSSEEKVKKALAKTKRYERWGDVRSVKFDDWWKSHAYLFNETKAIRELEDGEKVIINDCLVFEVPLNNSATALAAEIRIRLSKAIAEKTKKKSRKNPSTAFGLTEGSELKLVPIREMLSVFRDVFLKNSELRGEKLLIAAHNYYQGRKSKKWDKVPSVFHYSDGKGGVSGKETALRNLNRYIQKAKKITLNVAGGEFPGSY